jgi:hypothetical protein
MLARLPATSPSGPQRDGLDDIRGRQAHQDDIGGGGDLGGRFCKTGTPRRQRLGRFGLRVVNAQCIAGVEQAPGHRSAHASGADKSDGLFRHWFSPSRAACGVNLSRTRPDVDTACRHCATFSDKADVVAGCSKICSGALRFERDRSSEGFGSGRENHLSGPATKNYAVGLEMSCPGGA